MVELTYCDVWHVTLTFCLWQKHSWAAVGVQRSSDNAGISSAHNASPEHNSSSRTTKSNHATNGDAVQYNVAYAESVAFACKVSDDMMSSSNTSGQHS